MPKSKSYGGFVLDAQGRVLLREPTNHFGGYAWTLPKGGIDPGETPEQAALREVLEETGWKAKVVSKVPGTFPGTTTDTEFFLMRALADTGKHDWETNAMKWATPDEAVKLVAQSPNLTGRGRDLRVLRTSYDHIADEAAKTAAKLPEGAAKTKALADAAKAKANAEGVRKAVKVELAAIDKAKQAAKDKAKIKAALGKPKKLPGKKPKPSKKPKPTKKPKPSKMLAAPVPKVKGTGGTGTVGDLMQAQSLSVKTAQAKAQARALRLTTDKLREVRAELATMDLGSWGWAERTAVMRRLQAAVSELSKGQVDLLAEGLAETSRVSARNAATWLRALDRQYLGVARPLRFDSLTWIDTQAQQLSRVRLRTYAKSFARYGAQTVEAIEDEVAKAVLSGEPWTVARKKVMAATKQAVGGKQWMVDRILRTETSAAYNGMQLSALVEEDDDVEDPMLKRLVATFDARTGRDSVGLHGQTVPVNDPFVDPYFGVTYQAPPNRPHDREIVVGWRASYGPDFEGGDKGYIVDTATPTDDAAFVIPGASKARAEGPLAIRRAMLSANLRAYRRDLLTAQRSAASLTDPIAKQAAAQHVANTLARINAIKAEQDEITKLQALLQDKKAVVADKKAKKKARAAARAEKQAAEATAQKAEKAQVAAARRLDADAAAKKARAMQAQAVKARVKAAQAVARTPEEKAIVAAAKKKLSTAETKQKVKALVAEAYDANDLPKLKALKPEVETMLVDAGFSLNGKKAKAILADLADKTATIQKGKAAEKLLSKQAITKQITETAETALQTANPFTITQAIDEVGAILADAKKLGVDLPPPALVWKETLKETRDQIMDLQAKGAIRVKIDDVQVGDVIYDAGHPMTIKKIDTFKGKAKWEVEESSSLYFPEDTDGGPMFTMDPDRVFVVRKAKPKAAPKPRRPEDVLEAGDPIGVEDVKTLKKGDYIYQPNPLDSPDDAFSAKVVSVSDDGKKLVLYDVSEKSGKALGGPWNATVDEIFDGSFTKYYPDVDSFAAKAKAAKVAREAVEEVAEEAVERAATQSAAEILGAEKLTVKEAAQALGLPTDPIRHAAKKGKLKAVEIPSPYKAKAKTFEIEAADLLEWAETWVASTKKTKKAVPDKLKEALAKLKAKRTKAAKRRRVAPKHDVSKIDVGDVVEIVDEDAAGMLGYAQGAHVKVVKATKYPDGQIDFKLENGKSYTVFEPEKSPIFKPAPKAAKAKPLDAGDPKTSKRVKKVAPKQEPPPAAALPEADVDVDSKKWKQVGGQGGSNDGGMYQNVDTGEKWYVKTPKNADIARNETLAAQLYRAAGVDVPDVVLGTRKGKTAIASRIVDGLEQNAKALKAGTVEGIGEEFVVDAWLANWDVVGMTYDNMLIRDGRAFRLDTGGALRYRAQGGKKGAAFGNEVTELETMRGLNPNVSSPQAASVFGKVTDEQLAHGIDRVLAIPDKTLKDLVGKLGPANAKEADELLATLKARREYLRKLRETKYKAIPKKAKPKAPAVEVKPEAPKPKVAKKKVAKKKVAKKKRTPEPEPAKGPTVAELQTKADELLEDKDLSGAAESFARDDEDHVRNELLAKALYDLADVDAAGIARSGLSVGYTGVGEATATSKTAGIADGFVVDAWLANWTAPNYMRAQGGKAIRTQMKGALQFKGTGPTKGNLFGDEVTELEFFRSSKNPNAQALYSEVMSEDVVRGIDRVAAISDEQITALVDKLGPTDSVERAKLRDKLIARREDLKKKRTKYAAKIEEEKAAFEAKKKAEKIAAEKAKIAAEKAKIEAAKRKIEEEKRRAEAAERIRKMKEEGTIPLRGRSWDRIPEDKQEKIIDSFFKSNEALDSLDSPLANPGGMGSFTESDMLSNAERKRSMAESRRVFEKTYPSWYGEIFQRACGSWSGNSYTGDASILQVSAVRFGLSDRKLISARAKLKGKQNVAGYIVDYVTGDVTQSGRLIGNIDDAFAAYYGHQQAILARQGVESVRVYRGLGGDLGRDLQKAIRNETGAREHIIQADPAQSWSESPMVATSGEFSSAISDGEWSAKAVLTREAEAAEIIADRRASPYGVGLDSHGGENEIILASNNRRVISYAQAEGFGREHASLGHRNADPMRDAWLFEVDDVGDDIPDLDEALNNLDRALQPVIPRKGRPTSPAVKAKLKVSPKLDPEFAEKAKKAAAAAKKAAAAAKKKALASMPPDLAKVAKGLTPSQIKTFKFLKKYVDDYGVYQSGGLPKGYGKPSLKKLHKLGLVTDGRPLYASYSDWAQAGKPQLLLTPKGQKLHGLMLAADML